MKEILILMNLFYLIPIKITMKKQKKQTKIYQIVHNLINNIMKAILIINLKINKLSKLVQLQMYLIMCQK